MRNQSVQILYIVSWMRIKAVLENIFNWTFLYIMIRQIIYTSNFPKLKNHALNIIQDKNLKEYMKQQSLIGMI
jgi:hypothetical protein